MVVTSLIWTFPDQLAEAILVQLPSKRTELYPTKVPREHLGDKSVHILDQERLAMGLPAHYWSILTVPVLNSTEHFMELSWEVVGVRGGLRFGFLHA